MGASSCSCTPPSKQVPILGASYEATLGGCPRAGLAVSSQAHEEYSTFQHSSDDLEALPSWPAWPKCFQAEALFLNPLTQLSWFSSPISTKMGKETGGKKMDEPHSLKSNEMAQCSFHPQQPLVCDTFKNCEGLSRVALMDGNGVVMLGKVISCERKEDAGSGGKKK